MHETVSLTEEVDPPPSGSRTASSGGYEQTKSLTSHDFRHVRNPFPKTRPFVRNQKKGHYSLSSPIGEPTPQTEQSIGQRGDSQAPFDEDDDRPPSTRDPRRTSVGGITDTGRPISVRHRPAFPSVPAPPSADARMTAAERSSGVRRGGASPSSFAGRYLFFVSVPFLSRFRFVPSGRLAPPGIPGSV
jgi:hypothetical protein